MKTATIGELVDAITTWNPSRSPDIEFDYIDLSAVDNHSKSVARSTTVTGAEAPSRARQLVSTGDVLVSTVRPNLNAVAVVPSELDGATVSTGFTVLRAKEELDGRFLFHWVRSAQFIEDMVRRATGASYPAVSDGIVKSSLIPVLPLSEQRRIAAILDQADGLRARRRQVLTHLDALNYAVFTDVFGDPGTWPSRWPMGNIGQLARAVDYGTSKKAGEVGEWPILRMGNVTDDGQLALTDLKYVDLTPAEVPKYTVRRGDMLFNRTNSREKVGKSAVVRTDMPIALAGYLVRVRFHDTATAEFVSAYLTSSHGVAVRRRLAKAAVNQANINATEMRAIPIAMPPKALRRSFAERLTAIAENRERIEGALAADDELFASLQSRAFRGQL